MAVTQQSLMNRAFRLAAGAGVDPHAAVSVDNVWAFEEAFPLALSKAIEEIGLSPAEIEHYRRQHTLIFITGSTTMPQDVLHRFLDSSTIIAVEDQDDSISSNFCSRFNEFMNPAWPDAMHHYASLENELHLRVAGGDPYTFSGEVELVAVSTPAIPTLITDTMLIPEDVADRLVEILADMIGGRAVSA